MKTLALVWYGRIATGIELLRSHIAVLFAVSNICAGAKNSPALKTNAFATLVPDYTKEFYSSYFVLSCFIFGNALTLFQGELFSWWGLLSASVLCVVLAIRWRYMISIAALVLGVFCASAQFSLHQESILPSQWERKEIGLTAQIMGLPKRRGRDVSFRAKVVGQDTSPELAGLLGKYLQLSCYRCPHTFNAGDVWRLSVRLKRPHGYASDGAFDYEKYLFRHQLVAKGYLRLKLDNTLLAPAKPNLNFLRLSIKERVYKLLNESVSNASAEPVNGVGLSVITALSIGDKSGFSAQQRQVLQDSGLSHLFAISGLHIGLVFATVMFVAKYLFSLYPLLFERIPRPYLCLVPAASAAIVYAGLAGFAVSTQRALLMLSVFMLTRLLVRDVSLLKVLLISAAILLAIDPFALLDTGFWLSCGAVLIIYLATASSSGDERVGLIRLQVCIWLGMLPLSAVFFGKLSLTSPVLNLVAVPLFCCVLIPATLLGILLNEVGLAIVAKPILIALSAVYDKTFLLLEWAASYRYSVVDISSVEWWHWALFIVALVLYRFARLGAYCVYALFFTTMLWPTTATVANAPDSGQLLKVTLLDVGQGLAMVIQTEKSVTVYDTGPKYSSGFTAADAVLVPYLRSNGIERIDRLIISHADNDHIGGYQAVVEAFDVGQVLTSRVDKLPAASLCQQGQQWREGNTEFKIISPNSKTPKGSNNGSCVLKLNHDGVSLLITGDIEKQVERFLLAQQADLKADIMLVPHQGSKTSSTAAFIEAVGPKLALVAAGYLNHYGHPHSSVAARYANRGIELLSTVDSGTIEVLIANGGYRVRPYRHTHKRFWHWRPSGNKQSYR